MKKKVLIFDAIYYLSSFCVACWLLHSSSKLSIQCGFLMLMFISIIGCLRNVYNILSISIMKIGRKIASANTRIEMIKLKIELKLQNGRS